ncbi:MAG: hypothetical protein KCHDKBKB_00386 [Elusimicrobia bacterium]|nr:hypothetical protein [Elusimicrobiota bacterium]
MKVLIAGYYGFGNLGDELILSSILLQLKRRYGQISVTVLSHAPMETVRFHQAHALSRWNIFALIPAIWRHDFLLLGGGGLLQNKTSQKSLLYYLSLVLLSRLLQTPVVLYAMGVESLKGPFSKWLTKQVLCSPHVTITLRDEASKKILADMGLPSFSLHLTADPVFSLEFEPRPNERYSLSPSSALIIPRFPCPSEGRTLFAILARTLRDEKKWRIKGMLFEPRSEWAHLREFNGLAILPEDDFFSASFSENSFRQISGFDWIISARFHGLVLAALAGKSFIGVGDWEKVGRICEYFKFPFLPWDADESTILSAVESLIRKNSVPSRILVGQLKEASLQTVHHLK